MLKGNKGEWSELYVLFSLLVDGKLYQSDIELKEDTSNKYEIIKAYKDENGYFLEFSRNESIELNKITDQANEPLGVYSIDEISEKVSQLYSGILGGKGRSFSIESVQGFLDRIEIQKIKAPPEIKSDIRLRIYDSRLASETDLGFSIKSFLGGNSTLFNTGPGNNFIIKCIGNLGESLSEFNKRTYKPKGGESKITFRLNELIKKGFEFSFTNIQSTQLWRNLKMVDGDLPEIIGWALFYRFLNRESKLQDVVKTLEVKDPLNLYSGEKSLQNFYEYKLKKLLAESAMGMTSEKVWMGEYDSFGGVIVVKEEGEIVCFHIYDFNLFRNYLLKNTIFEQPATGEDPKKPGKEKQTGKKFYYGWLYEENGDYYIKLNLQIRFI